MIDRSRESGRRAPRLATQLPGTLIGRSRIPVQVLDISQRGCLARCSAWLDRGLIMDLEITIDGEAFLAKARVAESSRDGESSTDDVALYLAGLEFLALTPQGELLLRRFLERERRRRQQAGA
jgi:hypothetical protein